MEWEERVARIWDTRYVYKFWSQNLEGRDLLDMPGVDGRIILKLTLSRFISGFSLFSLFTSLFNLLAPEFYIQILAHPVCKMWIIQEPKSSIMK